MKKIIIAGTHSGVGKTTIAMGLMANLSKKMSVQPFKVGPDYIDSAFHTFITGNKCSNLDSYLLDPELIKYFFLTNSKNRDISIIEGVMGLFDGSEPIGDIGSTASIAKILNTPVILVVDGSSVSSSIAATVKGFNDFDENLRVAGVIINNVGSKKHYNILKIAIEHNTPIPVLGYLLKDSKITMLERHLGLIPASEQHNLEEIFNLLGNTIEETVDINRIIEISTTKDLLETKFSLPKNPANIRLRVGIAMDKAFNFYYGDSLNLLSDLGVEWVPYSPLFDEKLPENIDGLYIGGGFPEIFAKEIEANRSMREDLIIKLSNGLPYIAECGGLIYLSEYLINFNGLKYSMTGWFKGGTKMTNKLQNFGYATLNFENKSIRVHEFHRSIAEIECQKIYNLSKSFLGETTSTWDCGYYKGNGVATYAHFHFGSNLEFGELFIERCLDYKGGDYGANIS